ncbi:MAG: low-density lipoprotein receptor class A repeat-containing protein [Candidatus Endonucleobacter sp. (ex Gigantidas childressi)]|nr:low-density lipoprotein receptor class A repeat-containing protein [Candidatus Endonucleobacter sp. (ex Gigantidas childressi)]
MGSQGGSIYTQKKDLNKQLFACDNREVVEMKWACDGGIYREYSDESDERIYGENPGCFPCLDRGFALREYCCNGKNDCADGSDEGSVFLSVASVASTAIYTAVIDMMFSTGGLITAGVLIGSACTFMLAKNRCKKAPKCRLHSL